MDEDSGSCSQETKTFSGKLAPLDEELSAHFRGPLKLLQFGVYYPSSGSNNKKGRRRRMYHQTRSPQTQESQPKWLKSPKLLLLMVTVTPKHH